MAYHGELQRKAEMEQRRQLNENGNTEETPVKSTPKSTPNNDASNLAPVQHPQIGKIADYDPQASSGTQFQSPYSSRTSQTLIYNSEVGGSVIDQPPNRQIGSVHDMDPVNHNYGTLGMGRVYRYV